MFSEGGEISEAAVGCAFLVFRNRFNPSISAKAFFAVSASSFLASSSDYISVHIGSSVSLVFSATGFFAN